LGPGRLSQAIAYVLVNLQSWTINGSEEPA